MYLRLGLTYLILFTYITNVTSIRTNGRTLPPRRNNRRAIPSEFLTPPAPPLPLNRSPNAFRHGKLLGSQPPNNESPGYFSRLMGWLNPFGRDLKPPPPQQAPHRPQGNANIQAGFLLPPPLPNTYGSPPVPSAPVPQAPLIPPLPPLPVHPAQVPQYQSPCISRPNHQLPQPPSPPTAHTYLPPLNTFNGRSCDPCNTLPWIPIHQNADAKQAHGGSLGNSGYQNVQLQTNLHITPSLEIKQPDFGYGPPPNLQQPALVSQQGQYSSSTGAIQNPHIYPGAVPPLFKATAFDAHSADSGVNTEVIPYESASRDNQGSNSEPGPGSAPGNEGQKHEQKLSQGQNQEPSGPSGNAQYVDVLPPGAEVSGSDSSAFDSNSNHQISEVSAAASAQIETSDKPTAHKPHVYETASGHIIHVEESPVIDLSQDNSPDITSSSTNLEAPLILQNADGTYGINASWPNGDSSRIAWPETQVNQDAESSATSVEAHSDDSNDSSLLLQALRNNNLNLTDSINSNSSSSNSINKNYQAEATTESLLKAVIKSYNNFEKEVNALERPRSYIYPRELNLQGSTVTVFSQESQEFNAPRPTDQQSNARKNKVQIIIPYTSDHMPTPFHTHRSSSEEKISRNLGRSVLPTNHNPVDQEFEEKTKQEEEEKEKKEEDIADVNTEQEEEQEEELDLEEVENLKELFNDSWTQKKSEESTVKPTTKANTSIDVMRLQKNIDNWTIQEYSRGTTATTSTPTYSHQLLQSKKIPDEYLTTESSTPVSESREVEKVGNVLAGFNYNDLEHEGSASSRVDFPSVQNDVSSNSLESSESSSISSDISFNSNEDASWEQLPVSISPLSNERVYVVTPQTALKPVAFNTSTKNNSIEIAKNSTEESVSNSTVQFESIEKSYQVLPQAVNNLAVVSTGPATVPLWGIMEHDEYAGFNKTSPKTLILYSGHSKVSHARS
ncbi:protein starmaker isoform X1 [Microplitis demolitor]|uniref:protein starmaker isoform X1 n=1 Tax=Microplitis demolitor TaxID=69319 RepID=UPI0004CD0433|nr:protein starmaker isoform X1 [Microplitis demolitor]